ncbi:MAG: hypothetical protein LBS76_01800 [Mycoplasmataceae bacterium]|nr:hypothetical protein [Mycoplasmataceae bacterium]
MLNAVLKSGFDGSTESIVFLVVGIVFILLTGLCLYWCAWCMRNKADPNIAETKNWFFKWMYKNRMLISMMVTVIVAVVAVVFMLVAFGVAINFDPVE